MSTENSNAVLVSLLAIIKQTTAHVQAKAPGAYCVQASGVGPLSAIPSTYKLTFRIPNEMDCIQVEATENTNTGQITWGPLVTTGPILGVAGNLNVCTVDIYPAYKAISEAGYNNPVFFCGLFQALVPHIYQPWYCFTPNNCSSADSSNYIFVNAITAEVRLFPTN